MKPIKHIATAVACVAASVAGFAAYAEDTDLFIRANGSGQPPNVLFVIDTAANFSASSTDVCAQLPNSALKNTVGGREQCALYNVIDELEEGSVNLGIMVWNGTGIQTYEGKPCPSVVEGSGSKKVTSTPGGCLVFPITPMDKDGKDAIKAYIAKWTADNKDKTRLMVKGDGKNTGGSMQEAWAYFKGKTGLSGASYAGLKPPASCNSFIIYIGNAVDSNGKPGDSPNDKGPQNAIEGKTATVAMRASPAATKAQQTPLTTTVQGYCGTFTFGAINHNNNGYFADEWAAYMYSNGIQTFSIGVHGNSCQADYAALLENMADVGGGDYFPTTDYSGLVAAMQNALSQMIAKNSVFASVTLPVAVNNNSQGIYLNRVYIGMFRPDANALPRWFGNLKQYRLDRPPGETTGLALLDARTSPERRAISAKKTGFISDCALSYWNATSDDGYWADIKSPTCTDATAAETYIGSHPGSSNTPDGDRVEKGGQGYTVRSLSTSPSFDRNIWTCDATCTSLTPFTTANITPAQLGETDTAVRDALVNWARGINNNGDEGFVSSSAVRPSVHGDVVHSRPVAINYGTESAPKVIVFYGGNDGVLRAVNGERGPGTTGTDIAGVSAGGELWSFIGPEFYGAKQIQRLRDNKVEVTYFGTPAATHAPKPYGFDGAIAADVNDSHAWIFATMRRGGRAIYAFDVTDLAVDRTKAKLLWKIGCPSLDSDTGCTDGMSDIGQTWSTPKVVRTAVPDPDGADGDLLVSDPVLVFGGGYDKCEDADPADCKSSAKGAVIYVVDAETGKILKDFDLSSTNGDRGVISDVMVVPDAKGYAKWIYATDLGGNIWRISGSGANTQLNSAAPKDWTITRVAALGCDDTVTTCTPQRKFMFNPDVVGVDGGVYYVMVGSGDREKPLRDYTSAFATENHFFTIKDVPTDPNWLVSEKDNCDEDVICVKSLVNAGSTPAPTSEQLANGKGWYLPMRAGEQVVTSAITVFGLVTFSTHEPTNPDEDACDSDLGTARVYNVRYLDASPRAGNNRDEIIEGGGLPPSPVAGIVKLDDGTEVPFIIGADPDSPLEGEQPTGAVFSKQPKNLTYWFIRK